jgi:hypothetical protein
MDNVKDRIIRKVCDNFWFQVRSQVRNQCYHTERDIISTEVWTQLFVQVNNQLTAQVRVQLRNSIVE